MIAPRHHHHPGTRCKNHKLPVIIGVCSIRTTTSENYDTITPNEITPQTWDSYYFGGEGRGGKLEGVAATTIATAPNMTLKGSYSFLKFCGYILNSL